MHKFFSSSSFSLFLISAERQEEKFPHFMSNNLLRRREKKSKTLLLLYKTFIMLAKTTCCKKATFFKFPWKTKYTIILLRHKTKCRLSFLAFFFKRIAFLLAFYTWKIVVKRIGYYVCPREAESATKESTMDLGQKN